MQKGVSATTTAAFALRSAIFSAVPPVTQLPHWKPTRASTAAPATAPRRTDLIRIIVSVGRRMGAPLVRGRNLVAERRESLSLCQGSPKKIANDGLLCAENWRGPNDFCQGNIETGLGDLDQALQSSRRGLSAEGEGGFD